MTSALDPATRDTALAPLLATGWHPLTDGRDGLRKVWKFRNFSEAFAFMTRAALLSEKMNHHPEWRNVYGLVDVTLTTHDCAGLSDLDLRMAQAMDRYALGAEVVPDPANPPPTPCQERAAAR
jgi:4a-hydroxytetrahydrobiopterin dehydratase